MPRYVDAEARCIVRGGLQARATKVCGASANMEAVASVGDSGHASDTRKADERQRRPAG